MVAWLNGEALPPDFGTPRFHVVDASADPSQVLVRVDGELDLLTAPELAEALDTRLRASPDGARFTVDLNGVNFMSAKGLQTLLDAARNAEARRCEFRVVGCQPFILRIIDITDSRQLLHVTADN